jgi:hypothetical protein
MPARRTSRRFDDLPQEKMLEKLGQMGFDTDALRGCPPEALAEILRVAKSPPPDDDGGDGAEFDDMPDEPEDAAAGKEKQCAAKARKLSEYARRYSAMPGCDRKRARNLREKARKYMDKYCPADSDDSDDGGADAPGDGAEVRKVAAHYERYREQFERLSVAADDFVGAFKAKRRRYPELTAAQFLGRKYATRFTEDGATTPTKRPAQSLYTQDLVKPTGKAKDAIDYQKVGAAVDEGRPISRPEAEAYFDRYADTFRRTSTTRKQFVDYATRGRR